MGGVRNLVAASEFQMKHWSYPESVAAHSGMGRTYVQLPDQVKLP